ncbi:MAG: V-type ATP synthase subunit I [Patescibacteria group bacterium]
MNLPAKKYEIIALKDKCEEILEEMQSIGVAEVISLKMDESNNEDSDFEDEKNKAELSLAEMKFAKNFLSRFAEKESFASNLIDSFFPEKEKYTLEEVEHLAESERMEEVVDRCNKLEKGLNKTSSQKDNLEREVEELKKFSGISISSVEKFKNFNVFVGSIARDKKDDLLDALKQKSIFFHIKWGGEEACKRCGFYLVYPKNEPEIVNLVKDLGVKEESVFWSRPPADLLAEKREEIKELKRKKEEKLQEAEELSKHIPKLKALIDWYSWELEKYKTFEKGEKTRNYFYLKLWVVKGKVDYLKEAVSEITPHFMLKELEVEEGERPPVTINNQGLMNSFETVTGVYGMPQSDEPDPTPFLAPFFAVAFGLALSDAGYGLLLMALSYLMGKKLKDSKNFFNLFIIAGVFTVLAGLFTGTFFGTDLFEGLRFVDAVDNPIEVLYLVSVFGLVQIFVGILVGFFWHLKQGNKAIAFGEKGGSAVFFLGIGLFALTQEFMVLVGATVLMMLLNVIFSEEKSIFKRALSGFGSLYDLIGYFSDVLSYSRLLALGLATGIIAMTINMIAGIFMEMIPVAGLDVAVAGLVLVFGHIANLLINALSSFIHAARLQFVEFFGNFMEGGGRRFKPFSKQGRFIEIIKNN